MWCLSGGSLQVALQALYKQMRALLPNIWELRTLHLRAVRAATAQEFEEGPQHCSMVFPSGSCWELKYGNWVCVH